MFFQINYDPMQEGAIGITLNKYDQDSLLFTQSHIYEVQDGTSYLMAIIEEGTYVLSIQSLVSTKTKIEKRGLGKTIQTSEKYLFSQCTNIHYSYLITSLTKGDSQMVELSILELISLAFMGDFDSILPGYSGQGTQLRQDMKAFDQAKCKAQDVPKEIVIGESGLDQSFTFKVSRKNYEVIDIITEADVLMRVSLVVQNNRNNVNGFLYEDQSMKSLKAYTEAGSQQKKLLTFVKGQRKAYKLKIVYDTLDESDECPTYLFRIAMKPLQDIADENLKCTGLKSPKAKQEIGRDMWVQDNQYAISSQLIEKYTDKDSKGIKYDMELVTGGSTDYYFDISVGFDFLTSEMAATLYALDKENNMYPLASTQL